MADYTEEIATALELIQEFGAACTWHSLVNGAPADPVNEPNIPGAPVDTPHSVNVAVFPFDNFARATFSIEGNTVPVGFMYGLMGQVSFTPAITDWLLTPRYPSLKVLKIQELAPDQQSPILYTVLLQL